MPFANPKLVIAIFSELMHQMRKRSTYLNFIAWLLLKKTVYINVMNV